MEKLINKLKVELIELLNLEEIEANDIDDNEPLFGDGIGLDSIDALEIIVLLDKEYGLKIAKPEDGKDIMYSVQTLAKYITENQK